MFRKIRWQLIVPMLSILVLVFGGLFASAQWIWNGNVTQFAHLAAQEQTKLFAQKIGEIFTNKITKVESVAHTIQQLYRETDARPMIRSYLKSYMNKYKDEIMTVWYMESTSYQNVAFFYPWFQYENDQIVEITENSGDTTGDDYLDNPDYDYYFGPVKTGKPYITAPYEDVDINVQMISVSTAVYDVNGKLTGITGLDMSLSELYEIGNQMKKDDGTVHMVLAADGTVLYHPDAANIFSQNINQGFDPAFKEAYIRSMQMDTNLEVVQTDEEEVIVISSREPLTGWTTIIKMPVRNILGSVNQFVLFSSLSGLIFILLFSWWMIRTVNQRIQKPLDRLLAGVERVGSGDYSEAIRVNENEEMAILADKFNQMTTQISDSREKLQTLNEELETTVRQRTRSILLLLNHAGQGFLSFNQQLIIDSQYSLECEAIFGKPIGGDSFAELVYDDQIDKIVLFRSITDYLWEEKDESQIPVIISLLPNEFTMGGRPIKVEYKPIRDDSGQLEQLMAIMTDVSQEQMLRKKMEEEDRVMRMIVKCVTQKQDLSDTLQDFRQFLQEQMTGQRNANEWLLELKRNVHSLKGNLGRFGMTVTLKHIHQLEDELNELNGCSLEELKTFLNHFDTEALWAEDLETLKEYLGESFFASEDQLVFNRNLLVAFEKHIQENFGQDDTAELKSMIKNLYFRSFHELLRKYESYTVTLAERMDKLVRPFRLNGPDVWVDPEYYKSFTNALVHIFRNIVDHGIEPVEQRIEKGKNEHGDIRFEISAGPHEVCLTIRDDGQGIDLDKVRRKALLIGAFTSEDLAQMTDEEAAYLILLDELSTKQEVTDLSGRGLGMGALKTEIEELGGTLEIHSTPNAGTTFLIRLPVNERMILMDQIRETVLPS